jgi:hypothetical protein
VQERKITSMIGGEYAGDLKDGVREGRGCLTWSNEDFYDGEFKNGLRHGIFFDYIVLCIQCH